MFSKPELNATKCTRWRKQFDIKQGLIMYTAIFVNLSGAQNINSKISVADKDMLPYPLISSNNVINQPGEIKVAGSKTSKSKSDYCVTTECINTASRVSKYMDTSFDPCDDFYKFACGQYPGIAVKSDDELYIYNHFETNKDKIQQQVRNVLEHVPQRTEPKYVKLMKTFYQSCMNTTNTENQKVQLFSDLIKKINGWPLLEGDSWKGENFKWEEFYSKIRNITTLKTGFFSYGVKFDPDNISNILFTISQTDLHILSNFQLSSPGYYELIARIAANLGADKGKIEKELIEITEMEWSLFYMRVPTGVQEYSKMTLTELEEKYSNILWKPYFNAVLKPFTEIRDDDVIIVSDSRFFEKFNKFISGTSKRTQANYLVWNAIHTFYNKLSDTLNVPSENDASQWKKCYEIVKEAFEIHLGDLYVKHYPLEGYGQKYYDDMVKNIFQQFMIIIEKADWLDQVMKDIAVEKLASMYAKRHLRYKVLDDEEIDKFYTNLEITPGNFLESFINSSTFDLNVTASLYRKSLNNTSWLYRSSSIDVNAYYFPPQNSFGLASGIQQGIFFNESRPHYMNYGAIGSVIGHEITHGFDCGHIAYDKEGNSLFNSLRPETIKQLESKVKCIIDQYDNYTAKESGLNVNGFQTLNENIADNGGLKVAYLAYEKWVEENGMEPLLPGVNYAQSQLFWISFAQTYCAKMSSNMEYMIIKNDEHSPSQFRILGSLMNRPEFARDFQCAIKSTKMNPEKKCSFW